ncbi:MAG: efflux RND transporter periplasmic adaptor subunit [Verrucomicrobiia bacterium]
MKKKRLPPFLFPVFVVLTCVGAGLFYFLNQGEKPQELRLSMAERRTIEQEVVLRGNVAPVVSTEVRSEVSGRIEAIPVVAGQSVRGGEPLIELDQNELKAELEEADLRIRASQLRAEQAMKDLERRKVLARREFINQKELQDAETDALLANNALEAERARRAGLLERLSKTTIRAPYDGVVLNLSARPGLVVTGADSGREGATLMEVADLSQLKMEAQVAEVDAARLEVGNEVEVGFESLPSVVLRGRISFISPAARKPEGSGDDVRFFPLEIELLESHERVKPGLSANARVLLERAENVVSVELAAVFFDSVSKESYVYARNEEGEFDRRRVVTGISDLDRVQILEGLAEGEEVSLTRPAWDQPTSANTPGSQRPPRGRRATGGILPR